MELSILKADSVMWHGLLWVGYDDRRQKRAKPCTNIDRFTKHYGPEPFTCAHIWEDFQTTEIPEARIDRKHLDLKYFLLALNWLYRYDIDEELSGTFESVFIKKSRRTSGINHSMTALTGNSRAQ
jgi:hypothetical protein